ncbi:WxL domain-containing protein [Enterococcus mundtii]|uniref:WxL domain-containing protein n=1 Tax=Enterococcus mundtii TaxID=53346 RepID=UPI001FBB64AD|nr:WxL domain-containing protein [Enterococcus mundtii]GKS54825.1 cell surface protein [Enterococcus mundtii]
MKMIRLATIAVLSSTIFSGGMTVFAEETRQVTTEGQITFEPNTEEELVVIPPVSEPDVEISPEIPGTTGPLSIMRAVTMDFGAQIISNEDRTYNMVAEMATLANPEEDSPTEVPYVSFAQVQDVRGTNAGWDLKVSLSDFTSNTQNNVLTGAEIELIDPRIQYVGSNQENAPSAHANNLKLIPNEGAVSVMTAAERQGAGASSVVWGDQADLNAQFAAEGNNVVTNDAIQLSVPGSTAKDATTYRATLTWELTTTPGEDAGESA